LEALPYRELPYSSVEVDVAALEVDDTSDFAARLFVTLNSLKDKKKTAVYLKVDVLRAHYMPVASMYGFKLHHAEVESDNVVMLLWLGAGENRVPPYATHHVGVGGLVVREGCILVVRESSKHVVWKLPGGYLNLGEEIGDAASREVWEETGIRANFERMLTVRHSQKVQFGRSDIYFIAAMKLANPENDAIKIDHSEIDEAKWMPIDEFRAVNKSAMLEAALKQLDNSKGLNEEIMPSSIPGKAAFRLYHG